MKITIKRLRKLIHEAFDYVTHDRVVQAIKAAGMNPLNGDLYDWVERGNDPKTYNMYLSAVNSKKIFVGRGPFKTIDEIDAWASNGLTGVADNSVNDAIALLQSLDTYDAFWELLETKFSYLLPRITPEKFFEIAENIKIDDIFCYVVIDGPPGLHYYEFDLSIPKQMYDINLNDEKSI